ncbi:MAG: ATP-binding protein [Tannerellaceae bacterium]|jgi:predicted ATP-binding protein involved in virulence|nr:ATP-binding protein [Tannerellaceae bacterium]
MKLKKLHIDSYKVLQDFDIDFCMNGVPADIIVIAGVNGTGKTTLLMRIIESIALYDNTNDSGRELDIDGLPKGQEGMAMIKFFSEGLDSLKTLSSYILRYVDKLVFEEGKTSTEAYIDVQQKIDIILKGFQLDTRFFGIDRDRNLIFTNTQGQKFGIKGLSSGEKQLLAKVFSLFVDEMKGKVVLMDEPEESLHPSWQSNLIPVLRHCAEQNDCQFILATHSPQIISSVYKEELRLLVRAEDGKIEAVTCNEGPYGWTVEKVLLEIQQVQNLRTPEIEQQLEELSRMIRKDETETEPFKRLWNKMEGTLGYSDRDLILMRMEMHRKRKKHEAKS